MDRLIENGAQGRGGVIEYFIEGGWTPTGNHVLG